MSWRDDAQRAAVARALLHMVRRSSLWTKGGGPTRLALQYLDGPSPLSSGEQLMLRLAVGAWNGDGAATVPDLLSTLPPRHLAAVGGWLVAYAQGSQAIDAWLDEQAQAWGGDR